MKNLETLIKKIEESTKAVYKYNETAGNHEFHYTDEVISFYDYPENSDRTYDEIEDFFKELL